MEPFKLQRTDAAQWFRDNISCLSACPVDTEAYLYVIALSRGDYETAYEIARKPNPFPYVCGEVCGHPCEQACRRGVIDEPISIRALKRTATELHNRERGHAPGLPQASPRENRVAIIGAGPAGLTCAHDLARLGYRVTIFEAAEKPGGMMVLGIPEYRLSRDIIQMEIEEILNLGVELQCKQALGKDYSLADLKQQGFRAVFLAIGAHRSKELHLEGRELDGVINGIEFLLNVNLGYQVELGRRVLVIGGGDVAIDVARTAMREGAEETQLSTTLDAARAAKRLGSHEVQILYRKSRELMSARAEEIEEAEREGVLFHTNIVPTGIVGEAGKVTGLKTVRCVWNRDAEGHLQPTVVEGSENVIPIDSIVLAIGQTSDLSFLQPEDGIETTDSGSVKVDSETLATSAPGIFAGGDCAFGPRLLIDAEGDGRKAARSIHQLLEGNACLQRQVELPVVPLRDLWDTYDEIPREPPPTVPLNRRTGFTEVELPYSLEQAALEASRCLHCHQNIFLDGELCILCGGCVDVCPYDCIAMTSASRIDWENEANDFPDASEGEGYAMILDETACIRCGLCVSRCPTAAIEMRSFELQEEWVYD
ncbi:MAG: FAD-dependent oxidoreductase [Planctomycetes bacterium]|nr:FAD-dependent oxidoreductase [Planctomycetota bacterium]